MQPDDLAVQIIVDLLESQTGQYIAEDRRWRIAPALSGLFRERGIGSMRELIVLLTENDDKLARQVVEALLNNETYFFRDRQVFDHLGTTLLPQLADQRRSNKRLRIWSVGCSTGQEALSIAMFFAEQRLRWEGWRIDILATDVSHTVIDFAKTGTYSNFQIQRGLGVTQMLGFFNEVPGGWQAKRALTEMVDYQVHNMLEPSLRPEPFDLVLCRNVLLYFDEGTRLKAFARLAEAIAPDGRLVLGGGEVVMSRGSGFEPDARHSGIFRLRSAAAVAAATEPIW